MCNDMVIFVMDNNYKEYFLCRTNLWNLWNPLMFCHPQGSTSHSNQIASQRFDIPFAGSLLALRQVPAGQANF